MNLDLLLPVEFTICRPKTDGSGTLSFHTGELTPEQVARFHMLRNSVGVLAYKIKGQLTKEEEGILDEVDLEIEGKTKSERLRNSLYRLWEQKPEGYTDFKSFYSDRMEKLIEQVKKKLE